MFVNILIALLIIGLTVLFGWLCYRSIRAQRLWVKIVGGIGFALLALVFVALAFTGFRGIAMIYFPGAPDPPDLTVAGTPEQIARGEYLMNISCANCHSAPDSSGFPSGQHPLIGGVNLVEIEGFGFIGDIVTENLTPGGKLASYSDGELFRALRHNVSQKGHKMVAMAYMPYAQLSDADIEAIIAYLRSLPPAEAAARTGDNLNFIGALILGAGMFGEASPPAPDSIVAPPAGETADYGKYVASFGECRGCHGPDMTGRPANMILPAVPNARPYTSTISREEFIQMMHTGVKPNGEAFPPGMPWQNASKMTDSELAALYAYLIAPEQ